MHDCLISFTFLGVNQLKAMFLNTEENVIREALERANDCVEMAILALLDEDGRIFAIPLFNPC